jgi:DNA-binding MarR family transcriptional regulator
METSYFKLNTEDSLEAIELLRRDTRSIVREFGLLGDAYFEVGITLAERHLLIELTLADTMDLKEMGKRLLIDKSTTSRLVAKAVKKGFISCQVDVVDRRRRLLELTKKGKDVLCLIEPMAQNQVRQALATLTSCEVAMVQQGMHLFAKGLEAARKKEQACKQ